MELLTFAPVPFAELLGPDAPAHPARWDQLSREAGIVSGLSRWILGLRAWGEAEREAAEAERDADRRERRLRHVADAEALLRVVELLGERSTRSPARRRGRSGSRGCAPSSTSGSAPSATRTRCSRSSPTSGGWAPSRPGRRGRRWSTSSRPASSGSACPSSPARAGPSTWARSTRWPASPSAWSRSPASWRAGTRGCCAPTRSSWTRSAKRSGCGRNGSVLIRLPPHRPRALAGALLPAFLCSLLPTESPQESRSWAAAAPRDCPQPKTGLAKPDVTSTGRCRRRASGSSSRTRGPTRAPAASACRRSSSRRRRRPSRGARSPAPSSSGSSSRTTPTASRSRTRWTRASATASACGATRRRPPRSPPARTFFRQSRLASQARWSGRLTRYDGLVVGEGDEGLGARLDPLAARFPVSASRLATYARCGFLYLLQNVLRLQPAPEPEERRRIDPLERGDLFHKVAERYLRELRDRGALPVGDTEAARARLAEMAEEALEGLVAGSPPRFTLLWQREKRRFHETVQGWLVREAALRRAVDAGPLRAQLRPRQGAGRGGAARPRAAGDRPRRRPRAARLREDRPDRPEKRRARPPRLQDRPRPEGRRRRLPRRQAAADPLLRARRGEAPSRRARGGRLPRLRGRGPPGGLPPRPRGGPRVPRASPPSRGPRGAGGLRAGAERLRPLRLHGGLRPEGRSCSGARRSRSATGRSRSTSG